MQNYRIVVGIYAKYLFLAIKFFDDCRFDITFAVWKTSRNILN